MRSRFDGDVKLAAGFVQHDGWNCILVSPFVGLISSVTAIPSRRPAWGVSISTYAHSSGVFCCFCVVHLCGQCREPYGVFDAAVRRAKWRRSVIRSLMSLCSSSLPYDGEGFECRHCPVGAVFVGNHRVGPFVWLISSVPA